MRTAEHIETIMVLKEILQTLKEMKQQEFEYWDTWKQAKAKEQNTKVTEGSS